VLIFEPNTTLIDSEINFLHSRASWANIIILIPRTIEEKKIEDCFTYDDTKEILQILRDNNFNFALIVGVDKSILTPSTSSQSQLF
jgi:ferrochelatase